MATHKTAQTRVFSMSMRRKEKEITQKVVKEEILRQTDVGRLGLVVEGAPYVVPMNFCYTEDKIYLHSHKDGLKMRELGKNPRVCFEVDEGEFKLNYKPKEILPVAEYLKVQGRFRHLSPQQIEAWQERTTKGYEGMLERAS